MNNRPLVDRIIESKGLTRSPDQQWSGLLGVLARAVLVEELIGKYLTSSVLTERTFCSEGLFS